ncbi:hypothetical protein IscW_ISCW013896 [Ixodes scapularis]|uniref:Uncharacterized protein n=1 Tax=Ixodes scapularis TaxID=6945 RepID=B7QI63_IXOSC|nr:hypothetical protein IscW_ISCW013896 [Ixodes scapularis]|eukprot:XP_002414870.1 hypothetical protein IscW_ISCW013896 [Ixodes scapularis]
MERNGQDNRRLTLQVKEKDREIRWLKSQANPQPSASRAATVSRSQRPASSGRVMSTSEANRVVTAKHLDTFSVSRNQNSTRSNGSSAPTPLGEKQTEVVKKRKEEQLTANVSLACRKRSHRTKQQHGNPKPPETNPKVERVKRNVTAKKIQRGCRNYRKRKASDASDVSLGSATNGTSTTLKRKTSTGSVVQHEA